ncbi:MAG: right-handed parallel beta-helix repeat-containing protein [Phycisphaerae bacterium]
MRIFLICFLLFFADACGAGVLYVPSADYPSIQEAISSSINGDTIIVAPGRYFENINFLGRAITVRSTDPNNPGIVATTIIDGNRPANINTASAVTFKSGETSASIIEGFTLTGGTGSWLQVYWEFKGNLWNRCGGAVLCSNHSSPTIRKNIITKNFAGQGGGIYCYDHSNAIITDNTISDNNAIIDHGFADPNPSDPNVYDHGDGGAIVGFQYCNPIITNNIIQYNHADSYGGGIHLRQWSNGTTENNRVYNNKSVLGAGIHITYTSSPQIIRNTIQHNICTGGGGGIYIYYYSAPLIEWNIITENEDWYAGGISLYWSSEPTIRNNIICQNTGRGILCKGPANVLILNNTISDNLKKYYGGGIQCDATVTGLIANNIITSNRGYGIYCYGSLVVIKFNDVWNNESGSYGGQISDLTGINGNISQNPLFAGIENYHIPPQSPCVNAGDSNTASGEFDFDNEERTFNTRIDIGADECVTNTSDFNNDGIVDFEDLFAFTENWLNEADFADFAVFAENWLWTGRWR